MKNKMFAAIDPFLFLAITSVIVSIFSLSVSIYGTRYQVSGVDVSKELKCDYTIEGKRHALGTMQPSAGSLEWGYFQTKGTSKCKYTFSYKLNTASKYVVKKSNYCATKNNKYYGSFKIVKSNGKKTYNFKNEKVAGKSTPSILFIDLAVL